VITVDELVSSPKWQTFGGEGVQFGAAATIVGQATESIAKDIFFVSPAMN
jgi:hypothetical protein